VLTKAKHTAPMPKRRGNNPPLKSLRHSNVRRVKSPKVIEISLTITLLKMALYMTIATVLIQRDHASRREILRTQVTMIALRRGRWRAKVANTTPKSQMINQTLTDLKVDRRHLGKAF
jgi:hypothetical protein